MSISEIAFKFSKVLNQIKNRENEHKISRLQKYVRDEMFSAIKNRLPSQEYYLNTKKVIEIELSNPNDVA